MKKYSNSITFLYLMPEFGVSEFLPGLKRPVWMLKTTKMAITSILAKALAIRAGTYRVQCKEAGDREHGTSECRQDMPAVLVNVNREHREHYRRILWHVAGNGYIFFQNVEELERAVSEYAAVRFGGSQLMGAEANARAIEEGVRALKIILGDDFTSPSSS